ncbi:MAG: hypothetical protein II954_07505 [Synergistaceae bacterium]|nr:hypothetical protein [Synergistaceae bacterium]
MRTRKFLLALIIVGLAASVCEAKRYITEPLLVPQSPYAGMTFYVYKPYNMPEGWYVTLDGYAVHKNSDGTWVYGTSEGPNLVATNYVVGSVVPSMAGITKWISDVQISELRKLPTAETLIVRQKGYTRSQMAGGKTYSTYIPDWTFSPTFMAIGNWKATVDRIGVLSNPTLPVAWSGKHPKVIYAWTGRGWHQINVKASQTPASALRGEYTRLRRFLRDSGFKWYEQDMPILAQQAKAWGYYWLGEISLNIRRD